MPYVWTTPGEATRWLQPPRPLAHSGDRALSMRTGTIMAVDDEPEALDLLRALFVIEGFDFVQASDAAQAIAFIHDRQPDLLIVDYMMPGMNGLELCEYLRDDETTSSIPIILYSAYTIPSRGSEKGLFERAISKPADHDELLRVVQELLAGS